MDTRQPMNINNEDVGTPQSPLPQKHSLDGLCSALIFNAVHFVADEKNEDHGETEVYGRLAGVNQHFHGLFKAAANAEREKRGKELLSYIVRGEPDKVDAILKRNPSLMLQTFTVKNPAGYRIKATPLRAALCSQDSQMTARVLARFTPLAGKEEALAQWNSQFPEEWQGAEQIRWQPLFDQLATLDQAIRQSAAGDITSNEDYKLTVRDGSEVAREHATLISLLKATQDEPIETGRAFNPNFMLAVTRLWDAYVHDFNYEDPKRLFCWQRILGGTQCFIPAADAASFIDWLDIHNLQSNQPQNRSMRILAYLHETRDWTETSFFAGDSSRLGVDYAIYGPDFDDFMGPPRRREGREFGEGQTEAYYSVKTVCFSEIHAALSTPSLVP